MRAYRHQAGLRMEGVLGGVGLGESENARPALGGETEGGPDPGYPTGAVGLVTVSPLIEAQQARYGRDRVAVLGDQPGGRGEAGLSSAEMLTGWPPAKDGNGSPAST